MSIAHMEAHLGALKNEREGLTHRLDLVERRLYRSALFSNPDDAKAATPTAKRLKANLKLIDAEIARVAGELEEAVTAKVEAEKEKLQAQLASLISS